MRKTVTIIGGGLAGLSSAVFLKKNDIHNKLDITIIEGSPKLGGRAYSFFDKERSKYFDNGQHILAGWYENTFDYLKETGTYQKLNFQNALEINYINSDGKTLYLKCPGIFAPMNIFLGLWGFKEFTFSEKLKLFNLFRVLFSSGNRGDLNASELLKKLNQGGNLYKYFWEPFILAVFNTKPENICAGILIKILKTGFLKINNSNLVIPEVNLNELFIDDAEEYFKKDNIVVRKDCKIENISIKDLRVSGIKTAKGESITSDYYISAVSFFRFSKMFTPEVSQEFFPGISELKSSSIISVHIFMKEDMPENMLKDNSFGMTGLIGKTVQWVFKRNKKHLSLVISGSDVLKADSGDEGVLTGKPPSEIFEIAKQDLSDCITGFKELEIGDYKVIKEKRATFIPDCESNKYRPGTASKIENLFIAGDWTGTGLPATIESAVTSGKKAADAVLSV